MDKYFYNNYVNHKHDRVCFIQNFVDRIYNVIYFLVEIHMVAVLSPFLYEHGAGHAAAVMFN